MYKLHSLYRPLYDIVLLLDIINLNGSYILGFAKISKKVIIKH